jgi:hypothetical protein
MIPERETEMRAAVYERQHGLSCDDADLMFIELDAERAKVETMRVALTDIQRAYGVADLAWALAITALEATP